MANDDGAKGAGAGEPTMTLDPGGVAQVAAQPLPFARGASGLAVAHRVSEAPAGTTPVPTTFGALVWRHGGATRLTLVVKASFSLLSLPAMTPLDPPEPYRTADSHHRGRPLAHVVAASDRVPWKTSIEGTAVGHARAPGGLPVAEMNVRLALLQGGEAVIDKTVRVVGDRAAPEAAPKPFTEMPVAYERASGGPGVPANPIGRGEDDAPPNLVDPVQPGRPAGFGPIAAGWPARLRKLGDTPRRNVEAPVLELPAGFPFDYFHSAPPDQQVARLDPEAVVVLDGFHADRRHIEVRLPGARAVGAVYGLDELDPGAPTELRFRADSLHLDADRWIATLTFRAYLGVRDEAQLGHLGVVAGVVVGGATAWVPPRREAPMERSGPLVEAGSSGPAGVPTGTMALPEGLAAEMLALPFDANRELQQSATVFLPEDAMPAPAAVPFPSPMLAAPPPVASPPPAVAPQPAGALAATPQGLTVGQQAAASAGFVAGAGPGASAFFHDPSKLPGADPAAIAPPSPGRPPDAAEPLGLERYAGVVAALDEPGARRGEVLEGQAIEPAAWREASRRWQRAMGREIERGGQALRDRFDAAYVGAWEQEHPSLFGLPEYARLRRAEQGGHLLGAIEDLGLPAPLAARLRRVWRRRVAGSPPLREALESAIAGLAEETGGTTDKRTEGSA
jgi:hypothetical protein